MEGKMTLGMLLVVSTHLKNIRQNGNLPQVGMKTKNIEVSPPRDFLMTSMESGMGQSFHYPSWNFCGGFGWHVSRY